jgi:two-component system, OmpR family, sensor histidine kinase CiaH
MPKTGHQRFGVPGNGIGVPDMALPRIFDRFCRADAFRSYEEGIGPGLPIAKWIADINHAKLSVQNAEECGTTVQILFSPALNGSKSRR